MGKQQKPVSYWDFVHKARLRLEAFLMLYDRARKTDHPSLPLYAVEDDWWNVFTGWDEDGKLPADRSGPAVGPNGAQAVENPRHVGQQLRDIRDRSQSENVKAGDVEP
jgi:hypothetical protein